MTHKEDRNWLRVANAESEIVELKRQLKVFREEVRLMDGILMSDQVEIGRVKVEMVDMDHRLMLVEGHLREPHAMLLTEEGRKGMVGQGGESKNAATGSYGVLGALKRWFK